MMVGITRFKIPFIVFRCGRKRAEGNGVKNLYLTTEDMNADLKYTCIHEKGLYSLSMTISFLTEVKFIF